ncbi:MAG TPA: beta-ketoacyl-ACP synthase II [Flavobacteriales bacterium]|nr:beta-ketoacyl-ACP synthase II [Flavobacteriales bacterium]
MERAVITGTGAITPLGNSTESFLNNVFAGVSGAGPITRFDASAFKTRFACEVKDFDPTQYFERNESRKYDRFSWYAVAAADEALKMAGISRDNIDVHRAGVIFGSGNGGIETFDQQLIEFAANPTNPRFNPYFIPKMLVNMPSGVVSIRTGFRGIVYTPVSACATGNTAIMDAANYIRLGKADVMIAGACEAPITYSAIGGFGAMKALSTRNDDPQKASRPFDKDRDGFVMGEGAGALILESLSHALARGANILGEVAGTAMTADAYHLSSGLPDGDGARRCMLLALEEAGLSPDQVDYINVHATSTPVGDPGEMKAVWSAFGDRSSLLISSTKSMTGHLLGAAGAAEAIISLGAIQRQAAPPTINLENRDPEIPAGLNIVSGVAKAHPIRVVLSNTFGFGGHNSSVILKAYSA